MPKARPHLGNQHRLCQVRVGASGDATPRSANGTVLDIIHARKLLKEAQQKNSSEQTRALVEQGAVPFFVRFLQSPSIKVRQEAVRALGSIAADSPQFRDFVLDSGGLEPILAEINESDKSSLTRDAACTIRHLCSGKPAPPFEWVSPALGTLAKLLFSSDWEVLSNTCWTLSGLASEQIAAVIDAGVCCRLVELFLHHSSRVQTHALRVVSMISFGDVDQKQVILECAALQPLYKLLSHTKQTIRKKSCGIVRNITAGSSKQIAEVISSDIILPVMHLLQAADNDIKCEAAAAICNVSAGGSDEVAYLIEAGCIKPMVDLLDISDEAILINSLQTLANILYIGAEEAVYFPYENPYAILLEEADGVAKIRMLLADQNEDVYQRASLILSSFFPLDLPVAAPVSASVLTMPENVMAPLGEAEADAKHVATEQSSVFAGLAWACQPPNPELAWACQGGAWSFEDLPQTSGCSVFGSGDHPSATSPVDQAELCGIFGTPGQPLVSTFGAGQSSGGLFGESIFGTTGKGPDNIFGGAFSKGSDTSFFGKDLAAGGMFIFGSDAAAGFQGQGATPRCFSIHSGQETPVSESARSDQGESPTCDSGTSSEEPSQLDQSILCSESSDESPTRDSGTPAEETAQSDQSVPGSESDQVPQLIQEDIDDNLDHLDVDLPEPPVPAPPDGGCWEWPLTKQEKKTRVGALERNIQLFDQQLILQELAALREFRASHDVAWKTHCKQRRSIG